jgi:hypothetical protein
MKLIPDELRVTRIICIMSHGPQRKKLSPEQETTQKESEMTHVAEYKALTEEIMDKVYE